ncbi:MAG: tetratricopeptide repeat protein [Planctomycetota bacterium]|nr:MAG: tetratricopeptide repeat protein [Planctomycetota bacterium]
MVSLRSAVFSTEPAQQQKVLSIPEGRRPRAPEHEARAVGLLDVFRRKSRRNHEAALVSPLAAATAVREQIQAGDLEQALDIAERGLERFPHSEAMQAAYRLLKREGLADEIAELRRKCEREDDPAALTRLAAAYRDVGEYDKALELCRRAIERFPEHDGPWYVLGRIRLDRFREEWLARDALLAIEYYEQAFDRNRTSYRALIDLAELYTKIGARRKAIRRCEAILEFAPEDERALALLQKAMTLPARGERLDLEQRVRRFAERQRHKANRRGRRADEAPPPDLALLRDPDLLYDRLHWLREHLEGFEAAIGLGGDGSVRGYCGPPSLQPAELARSLHPIFEAAFTCSLRMDMGRLRTAVFEADSGLCVLVQFGELRLALLCSPEARLDRTEAALERWIEHELYR